MKKVIISMSFVSTPFAVWAQNNVSSSRIFETCANIFVIGLWMLFAVTILKTILNFFLKNKIIARGTERNLAASILQTKSGDNKYINIKWFAILAGIGCGLTIIYYTPPLGIHSLAIMAFCLAASFLGYFLFIKRTES